MSTVIDVGHGPGTSRAHGSSSSWCNERELCMDLGPRIAQGIAELGSPCRLVSDGAYKTRPNGLPLDIVVSLHADSQQSQTPYALALVHDGDSDSFDAAVCILERMGALTSISRCVVGVWYTGKPEGTKLAATETRQGFRIEFLAWSAMRGPICVKSYPRESARVLLEVGSLTHQQHRNLLTSDDGRSSLSAAIAQGITDYL